MMPRSYLEDMAWEYNSATEIGEYQVAAGGWDEPNSGFFSICNT